MTDNTKNSSQKDMAVFVQLLEREAQRQSVLSRRSPLPASLHRVSAFIALHVWQVSLALAVLTALIIELV